jgi:NADPH-dependent 2,4-dienoyl-CoA reductase/sulfur reductase-like enzyme
MRFLIVGGSDAGISAALRARELDDSAQITIVLADAFANYSICGLPFYLSGETPHWEDLAHRKSFLGIEILKEHTAVEIDPSSKTVVLETAGAQKLLGYDRLLIATGARPIRPAVPGLNLPGVYPLHTMEDSFRLHHTLTESAPRSVIIVGSGYIGLEMADAFTHRGLKVTLWGRAETVLPTVDAELGQLVEGRLKDHGVTLYSGVELQSIEEHGAQLHVTGSQGTEGTADLVLIAAGVEPNATLGRSAGVTTGTQGALRVDRRMRTNLPDVYAAGDCAETWHRLLGEYTYLPLGTTSHKQGRVAGENAIGGSREFAGSLGTQVVKVFDLAIARSGLRDIEARRAGFDPVTVETRVLDHKAYYPDARPIHIRVTGDRLTGRLLGAQCAGFWHSEIAKRIDVFATALFHEMTVEALSDLDLSYTPPFSSPWDPVQTAAQAWAARREERGIG